MSCTSGSDRLNRCQDIVLPGRAQDPGVIRLNGSAAELRCQRWLAVSGDSDRSELRERRRGCRNGRHRDESQRVRRRSLFGKDHRGVRRGSVHLGGNHGVVRGVSVGRVESQGRPERVQKSALLDREDLDVLVLVVGEAELVKRDDVGVVIPAQSREVGQQPLASHCLADIHLVFREAGRRVRGVRDGDVVI